MPKEPRITILKEDAIRIKYLLELLLDYTKDVGPRELRGCEEEAKRLISILPKDDLD